MCLACSGQSLKRRFQSPFSLTFAVFNGPWPTSQFHQPPRWIVCSGRRASVRLCVAINLSPLYGVKLNEIHSTHETKQKKKEERSGNKGNKKSIKEIKAPAKQMKVDSQDFFCLVLHVWRTSTYTVTPGGPFFFLEI